MNIITRYVYALFIRNDYNTRNFFFRYALTLKTQKAHRVFSKQFTFKNFKQS